MSIKIVADSSCDIKTLPGADFTSVPLTITAGERDFVDDEALNATELINFLKEYKGRTHTACPSIDKWIQSFSGADEVYAVTITSGLSGTYNSAMVAGEQYMQENPGKKVHVFDSLSTGPEMRLLLEKLAELTAAGLPFEQVVAKGQAYQKTTRLFFSLESLHNMVQNGRVSKVTAAAAGMLGIRVLGTASPEGTLTTVAKCRGDKKVISSLMEQLGLCGYKGGRMRIAQADNLPMAQAVEDAVKKVFPAADIVIGHTGGLCSYYAEKGGILVGLEGAMA